MTPEATGIESESRIRQEQLYESSGHSAETVTAKLEQGGWKDVNKGACNEFMLWVGFSDSIRNLDKIDFTGKRVLTVAGSGEFSQAFINRGSSQVDIFDTSMVACFFNELKLIAARELSYREYIDFFATIAPGYGGTIFDQAKFERLKPFLTTQAQTYFKQITTAPEYRGLFKLQQTDSPVQTRMAAVFHTDIVSFLASEENYMKMQERLRHANWSMRIADVNSPDLPVNDYDFVYISNIGFGDQVKIANRLLHRGAKLVGFTFGKEANRLGLPLKYHTNLTVDSRTGEIANYYDYVLFSRRDLFWPVSEYDAELARKYGLANDHQESTFLIPGASFVCVGTRFRVAGIDPEADFPYLVTAESVHA